LDNRTEGTAAGRSRRGDPDDFLLDRGHPPNETHHLLLNFRVFGVVFRGMILVPGMLRRPKRRNPPVVFRLP